jgi:hypothetical protein
MAVDNNLILRRRVTSDGGRKIFVNAGDGDSMMVL